MSLRRYAAAEILGECSVVKSVRGGKSGEGWRYVLSSSSCRRSLLNAVRWQAQGAYVYWRNWTSARVLCLG